VAALVTLEGVKVTRWRKGLNPKQAHFTLAVRATHQRWDAGIVVVVISHGTLCPLHPRRAMDKSALPTRIRSQTPGEGPAIQSRAATAQWRSHVSARTFSVSSESIFFPQTAVRLRDEALCLCDEIDKPLGEFQALCQLYPPVLLPE